MRVRLVKIFIQRNMPMIYVYTTLHKLDMAIAQIVFIPFLQRD